MEETIKLLDKTLDQHYVRWSFEVENGSLDTDSGQCKVLKKSESGKQSERVNDKAGKRIMMKGWRSSLRTRMMRMCTFSQRWKNYFNYAYHKKIY